MEKRMAYADKFNIIEDAMSVRKSDIWNVEFD